MLRKRLKKLRKYTNIVEAVRKSKTARKLTGLSVFTVETDTDNKLVSRFSPLGLFCFLFWLMVFFYCSYVSAFEDQTILRVFYKTKLKHYGDVFERIASLLYVLYSVWKIPFDISLDTGLYEAIVEIDTVIEKLSVPLDFCRNARLATFMSVAQLAVGLAHVLSVPISLSSLNKRIPVEAVIRVAFYDILAMATISHYCFYLILLMERYNKINGVLKDIKERKAWEYSILVRGTLPSNTERANELKESYICGKIKSCARIYSLLYKAQESAQKKYGFALVLTMLVCILHIILYSFYFMEATAAGLFHDMQTYINFLLYVFWQNIYAFGVIFATIYCSECTVEEATETSYITHDIINYHINPGVIKEAMQLSQQLLHQVPVFTACGLYRLNYVLLLEGARTVTTFLVILLQFMT